MVKSLVAVLALAVAPALAQGADNPKCTPNPVFDKFPGSFHKVCERSRFDKVELVEAADPARPRDKRRISREGEYWYYYDPIARDGANGLPSQLEVFRNFENALRAAGGTVIGTDSPRHVYYRIKRPSGEYWGQAGCGGGNAAACNAILHKIVRIADMEQSVVVSADQIRKSLDESGRVVFYGIHFDTDKAVVKPESGPTLAEMAKYLKANAQVKVFIVGHTDMQGPLDRNQGLSRERAAAVVNALATVHGIAPGRMAAEGVGPLAPVAANDAEAGRARNRRVEMVLR